MRGPSGTNSDPAAEHDAEQMPDHRNDTLSSSRPGTGLIEPRLRPASAVKRVWAFIIDQFLVGAFVACLWAPLVLAIGDPLRFEPLLPLIEPQRICELADRIDAQNQDGAETMVTEHICTTTYFKRWKSYEHVRDQQTVSDGVRFTSTTYYPTDQEGKPIWVINDGLIITLVLLIYFTLLEGTASGRTLGKFMLGLTVVGEEGVAMTKGRAFARSLVKLLPIIVLYTAGVWRYSRCVERPFGWGPPHISFIGRGSGRIDDGVADVWRLCPRLLDTPKTSFSRPSIEHSCARGGLIGSFPGIT